MNTDKEMDLIEKNILNNDSIMYLCTLDINHNIGKEYFINKYLEKFPKAKLHTIIKINKHYDYYWNIRKNIVLNNNIQMIPNIQNI
jgi:hypothetical protein